MSRSVEYRIERARYEDLGVVKALNEMLLPENYPFYFYETLYRDYGDAFYVARVGGEIVGYVMCRVEKEFRLEIPFRFDRVGHIVSIAVKPEYRGMGIGRSLMEAAIKALRERYGVKYVYLEVRVSNTGAIRFYERLGFRIVKRVGGYYRDGEDAYIMRLDF